MPSLTLGAVTPILVHGSHVLAGFSSNDEPEWISDAAVLVRGSTIESVGPYDELSAAHPEATVVGGTGHLIMPGLINAHHHVGLTPFQLGSPDLPLELWFASRIALRDVDLYLDTLYSAFEMVASGVTTVQHLHSRAPGTAADLVVAGQTVMRAYRDIGMRASYSMALRDQNRIVYEADDSFVARLPTEIQPRLAAYLARFTVPFADQVEASKELLRQQEEDPLVRVQLAPANLHWLSDRALEVTAELAREAGAPLHMHLLETPYQRAYALKRTGGSAVAYIEGFGIAGPQLTLGHGVWMTDEDIELCAAAGIRICHNASSNLRLKSGIAPLNRFLARGLAVAIGIDEAGLNDDRDMLQELRLVLRLHREPGIDASQPSASAVLRMATEHGANTTPFGRSIGQLRGGRSADLVVLDWTDLSYPYQSPDLPRTDVVVHRAKPSAVRTVMIGGEIVYHDGRFTRVNRGDVLAEIADRLSVPLTAAERERRALATAVMPHVRQLYEGYLDAVPTDPHYRINSRI